MGLREVLRDNLVDLRLRVWLHSRLDEFQNPVPQHNDPQPASLTRIGHDLFEVVDRRVFGRLSVDGHEPIAGPQSGAIGRAVLNDRFDRQSGIQLHDLDAEISAAGEHLTDDAIALGRLRSALFRLVSLRCGSNERHDGGKNLKSSEAHE